jgi:hypothetical protein
MSNQIQNLPVVLVGNTEIPLIAYRGKAALTTELLATLYGAEEKNIQNNYQRNPDRFEIGKHFFKLEGEELTIFKMVSPNLVAKNAKHLMLWTERGAARHAKLVETDQAWDVFEKLEDAYFDAKPEREAKEPRAKMESKIVKFLEGKPMGVATTAIGVDCFQGNSPLPLHSCATGLYFTHGARNTQRHKRLPQPTSQRFFYARNPGNLRFPRRECDEYKTRKGNKSAALCRFLAPDTLHSLGVNP